MAVPSEFDGVRTTVRDVSATGVPGGWPRSPARMREVAVRDGGSGFSRRRRRLRRCPGRSVWFASIDGDATTRAPARGPRARRGRTSGPARAMAADGRGSAAEDLAIRQRVTGTFAIWRKTVAPVSHGRREQTSSSHTRIASFRAKGREHLRGRLDDRDVYALTRRGSRHLESDDPAPITTAVGRCDVDVGGKPRGILHCPQRAGPFVTGNGRSPTGAAPMLRTSCGVGDRGSPRTVTVDRS